MPQIKKYRVKHFDRQIIVHWDGFLQPGDMSLCGHDLMGDSLGWHSAVETNDKVNCIFCLRTIEHINNINLQMKKINYVVPKSKDVLDFLNTHYTKGATTEEIADHFEITDAQCGRMMLSLGKTCLIRRYPKGTIFLKSSPCANTAPVVISKSYYEIIQP